MFLVQSLILKKFKCIIKNKMDWAKFTSCVNFADVKEDVSLCVCVLQKALQIFKWKMAWFIRLQGYFCFILNLSKHKNLVFDVRHPN